MPRQLFVIGVNRSEIDFETDFERCRVTAHLGGARQFLEAAIVLSSWLGADKCDLGVITVERQVSIRKNYPGTKNRCKNQNTNHGVSVRNEVVGRQVRLANECRGDKNWNLRRLW